MTISEYYECYKTKAGREKIKYPIDLEDGSAQNFDEFYEKCIEQHIKLIENNALKWHEMLLKYVERDDATFWIRRYESSSQSKKRLNNGRWPIRRACKTEYDDFSYVFVSNYDAHEIFNMIRFVDEPNDEEFALLMKEHRFPLHYDSGTSSDESMIASYPLVGSTRGGALTVKHWYLAHILGVNNSEEYDCDVNFNELCPRGDISEWKQQGDFVVRKIDEKFPGDKNVIVAHFLRFIDPLNYYVVPGKSFQDNHNYKFKNNQIGEYTVLNDYMAAKYIEVYGEEKMNIFRKKVLAKPLYEVPDHKCSIDIEYGPKIKSQKKSSQNVKITFPTTTSNSLSNSVVKIKAPRTGRYSYDEKIEEAAYYLRHQDGLVKVEKNILNIANGRGTTAKIHLNSLEINTERAIGHKGLLISSDIDDEISKATGIFKNTLEEIKKRGL